MADTETTTTLKITLVRSLIGNEQSQRLTARALGLNKVGSSVTQPDNGSHSRHDQEDHPRPQSGDSGRSTGFTAAAAHWPQTSLWPP